MWYAMIVVVAGLSLGGAAVPLYFRPTHARLQTYLSVAAGALLGAAMFHLLPESSHLVGSSFGWAATIGIVLIFLMQRYLAPHSHEPAAGEGIHAESPHVHDHDDGSHAHVHQGHDLPAKLRPRARSFV